MATQQPMVQPTFLSELPDDDSEAALRLLSHIAQQTTGASAEHWTADGNYLHLQGAWAALLAFYESRGFPAPTLDQSGDRREDVGRMLNCINNEWRRAERRHSENIDGHGQVDNLLDVYREALGTGPCVVEFTADQLTEVRALTDQLREAVSDDDATGEPSCLRILKRVESLQQQLNHQMRSIDAVMLLMGEMAMSTLALAKRGPAVKNLVREVTNRVFNAMASTLDVPVRELFGARPAAQEASTPARQAE